MPISQALLKYGHSSFSLEILEYCAKEDCIKKESFYIAQLKPEYNICKEGKSRLGIRHTLATIAKISVTQKGKLVSEETRAKQRAAKIGENHPMFGKTHSEEAKAKISTVHTGKTVSEETRAKISAARVGKLLLESTKVKLSIGNKGEKNPMFGKTHNEKSKALIRTARLGKSQLSELIKIKMSEASGTAIKVFDLKTNETSIYSSMKKAAKALGVTQPALSFRFKTNNSFLLKERYQIEKLNT